MLATLANLPDREGLSAILNPTTSNTIWRQNDVLPQVS